MRRFATACEALRRSGCSRNPLDPALGLKAGDRAAEWIAGAGDDLVIDFAQSEQRLLLTEDKDFGQLVFAAAKENSGVILIRYPASARSTLTAAVVKLLSDNGENLYSCFAVLEPWRVRITQLVT